MVYGLWLSAAGLTANQYRQDLIANNLANVETSGFKHDLAVFSERLSASREPGGESTASHEILDGMTGGLFVAPTYTSFEQGAIVPTRRPLDLALQGQGFFVVRTDQGTAYTRDGRLHVNSQGELRTVVGDWPVLGEGGTPVRIPRDRLDEVQVTADGVVRVSGAPVARLSLVDFADRQQLRKRGGNLFVADAGASQRPASASVVSGAVERSTVEPMSTMVAMIEASRAYQLNATMISLQDGMLGRAANDIARLS